jgi:hypothetical protein
MNAPIGRDEWRQALIAFYRAESPWMRQKVENLEQGALFDASDVATLRGLQAALERLPVAA